jgi:hypothetical protein
MKKIKWLGAVAFVILMAACAQNKASNEGSRAKDEADTSTPEPSTSSATFTINGKTFTCSEVGAVGYQKDNSIIINANSGADGETIAFTFELKGIKEGTQKFSAPGNAISFTTIDTYFSKYKSDCTDEDAVTEGTINITKLINYTPEKEGRLEGNFEGQLAVTRPVADYPCSNGKTANRKTELVTVKGNFAAGYINTKEVPL